MCSPSENEYTMGFIRPKLFLVGRFFFCSLNPLICYGTVQIVDLVMVYLVFLSWAKALGALRFINSL